MGERGDSIGREERESVVKEGERMVGRQLADERVVGTDEVDSGVDH